MTNAQFPGYNIIHEKKCDNSVNMIVYLGGGSEWGGRH